jgi:hypothetical protein
MSGTFISLCNATVGLSLPSHDTLAVLTTQSTFLEQSLVYSDPVRELTKIEKNQTRSSFRSRALGVGCMESHLGDHYRQTFQEVLHKQCFGRIRR